MTASFLLVNTNVALPPVSPVGLEYVGEALVEAGTAVHALDFVFEADWKSALAREIKNYEPLAVGLSVRNTDDCCSATRRSFLPWLREVVSEVKRLTRAPVLLGGVGFSILPRTTLSFTGADAGIAGDGEDAALAFINCLINGEDFSNLSNLVYRNDRKVICNHRVDVDLRYQPLPRRRLFDNKKYEELGAMVGIETKRGCAQQCIFCADPLAKGSRIRLRPPLTVLQEFQDLLAQEISWFHLCDSEFNLPIRHAKEVCRNLIQAGLGDKIRWYCYCSPVPFDSELAGLMKRAGCAGINFGIDSLCDEQLSRLGRSHSVGDIKLLVNLIKENELNFMFDLLIGGPGENEDTIRTTIEKINELNVPLVGISAGIRVYPGTILGKAAADGLIKEGMYPPGQHLPTEPLFYFSPSLGSDAPALINELIAGDPRFMFLSAPAEEKSYNYADDERLCRLIKEGARGAYWDIIHSSQQTN